MRRFERGAAPTGHAFLPGLLIAEFGGGYWAVNVWMHHVGVAQAFADGARVEYGMWCITLGLVAGYALAAGTLVVVRLIALSRTFERFTAATYARWTLTVGVVMTLLFGSLFASATSTDPSSVDSSLAVSSRPVTIGAALCMMPCLVAFLALRAAAQDDTMWAEDGLARVQLLLRYRVELRRFLTIAGAFLTVVVVATGMRRRALLALPSKPDVPPESVILYGLVFAALLAVFFVAASAALDHRASRTVDEFHPLPAPDDPALTDRIRARNELATLVGGGDSGGTWRSFQTSVVIVAPLLTALIGGATGR